MIIDTNIHRKKKTQFSTPQTPKDGQMSPVDLPADKLFEGRTDVLLNVFSKGNYKHEKTNVKPSYAQIASPATPGSESDEESGGVVPLKVTKNLFIPNGNQFIGCFDIDSLDLL